MHGSMMMFEIFFDVQNICDESCNFNMYSDTKLTFILFQNFVFAVIPDFRSNIIEIHPNIKNMHSLKT